MIAAQIDKPIAAVHNHARPDRADLLLRASHCKSIRARIRNLVQEVTVGSDVEILPGLVGGGRVLWTISSFAVRTSRNCC